MTSTSDLAPARLAALLKTNWLGRAHEHHDALASSNDEAQRRARDGGPHGLLVSCDAQSDGRGRLGRAWFAPAGKNLTVSLLLRPEIAAAQVSPLALAAGLGLADGLADPLLAPLGERVGLKWPNDVLVSGAKIAGVLVEMIAAPSGAVSHVVLGFGLNVNTQAFPDDLARPATSLAAELGRELDRAEVLAAILAPLERWLDTFFAEGAAPVVDAFAQRADLVGRAVVVDTGAEVLRGVARGLAPSGALMLKLASGEVREVYAGDLTDGAG